MGLSRKSISTLRWILYIPISFLTGALFFKVLLQYLDSYISLWFGTWEYVFVFTLWYEGFLTSILIILVGFFVAPYRTLTSVYGILLLGFVLCVVYLFRAAVNNEDSNYVDNTVILIFGAYVGASATYYVIEKIIYRSTKKISENKDGPYHP